MNTVKTPIYVLVIFFQESLKILFTHIFDFSRFEFSFFFLAQSSSRQTPLSNRKSVQVAKNEQSTSNFESGTVDFEFRLWNEFIRFTSETKNFTYWFSFLKLVFFKSKNSIINFSRNSKSFNAIYCSLGNLKDFSKETKSEFVFCLLAFIDSF